MKANRYWTVSVMVVVIALIMLFNAMIIPPATGQTMAEVEGYSFSDIAPYETIWAVEVKGDFAYLGVERRLVIVDVSHPLSPVKLGETENLVESPGIVRDVAVSGNHAYVAAGSAGIQIVDVSDPLHPQVVDAYVAANSAGIQRVDVSDPLHPQVAGDYLYGLCALGVTVEGAILVGAWNDCGDEHVGSVGIYDITDPIHPLKIGSAFNASFATPYKNVVTIAGDYVYAAIANGGVLDIIPIVDPSAHIVFYDWPDGIYLTPISVVAFDHYLYVAGIVRLDASGSVAYASDNLVAIFDISDPVKPVWVNSFGDLRMSMVIDNEKLYLGSGIIDVYDLADPADPSFMSRYIPGQFIHDIDVQDNCLYTGAYLSSFYVLCTSEPIVTPTPSPTASVGEKLYLPLIQKTAS